LHSGIGTSQVRRDVLASQTLGVSPLKVRRIDVQGQLAPGVFAKDVILTIIARLGVKGGTGYAYEYGGDAIDRMTMDERMTICNMSIEGGARAGYVNPDKTTVEYLRGRRYAPTGEAFERATSWWLSMASDKGAQYDDRVVLDAAEIEPTVTWGINPGQSVGVGSRLPKPSDVSADERPSIEEAIEFMGWSAGQPIAGPGSTSHSSARARMGVSDLRRLRESFAATGSRHMCARWSCRDPGSSARRRTRGSTKFPEGGIRLACRRLLDVSR
jgi:3-isopropylmalate/(R)-2-methylmalate dehydratase large subunit